MRALAVVPRKVKIRVAVILITAIGAWGSLGAIGQAVPALRAYLWTAQALILVAGLYVAWCLWPRLRTGIAAELLCELEQPPGQRVRLTLDDGPTPGVTDEVLGLLAASGVRASFFVLVAKARRHPELVRRIVQGGHVLGLHGEDHRSPFLRPAAELHASLGRARAELASIAGVPVTLYRPSHGWKNRALIRAVRAAGLRICFWDYGVWDTDAPPVEVLLERLRAVTPRALAPGERGPLVLVHDGRGDEPGAPPHAAVLTAALRTWLAEVGARPPAPA